MGFSLQSQEVNSAQVELNVLNSQGVAGSNKTFTAFVGGAVVQEYDRQIQAFTAELTAMNVEKGAIREDKTALTTMEATAQTYGEEDGIKNSDGSPFVGEAVKMSEQGARDFAEQAAILGVEIDADNLPMGSGTDRYIDVKFFDSMQEALDNKLGELNSMSELKAIQFQSLMDARKQAMIMLSNLVNSDHQVKMAIVQNMKG